MHVLSTHSQQAPVEDRRLLLEVAGVSKRFASIQALDAVDFTVAPGEVHGLCGHNGAGKSTLVKVLTGLVQPDEGRLSLDGRELRFSNPREAQASGVALVDQELSVIPALSVVENLFIGDVRSSLVTRRRAQRTAARELLERVGLRHVRLGAPASELAIGERQLLEIARALNRGARLLILDEPTATLSRGEIERVFAAVHDVAAHGCAVIFISHRLDEVLSLCSRVTVMRDGRVVGQHVSSELDRPRLIHLLLGEAGTAEPGDGGTARPAGETVLSIDGLAVPGTVEPFELDVRAGQVVGLAGQIGSGASAVLRALGGLTASARGSASARGRRVPLGSPRAAARAGVAFVSDDRKQEGLFLGQTTLQNLVATRLAALSRGGALRRRAMRGCAGGLAQLVGVDGGRLDQPTGNLSGGNQQKVFIGRCLERDGVDVMLLDEPTRGVDVGGRADIHALVRAFTGEGRCALFASTELDELLDLSDVIVTMFEGRVVSVAPRAEWTPRRLLAEMTTGRHEQATVAA